MPVSVDNSTAVKLNIEYMCLSKDIDEEVLRVELAPPSVKDWLGGMTKPS